MLMPNAVLWLVNTGHMACRLSGDNLHATSDNARLVLRSKILPRFGFRILQICKQNHKYHHPISRPSLDPPLQIIYKITSTFHDLYHSNVFNCFNWRFDVLWQENNIFVGLKMHANDGHGWQNVIEKEVSMYGLWVIYITYLCSIVFHTTCL